MDLQEQEFTYVRLYLSNGRDFKAHCNADEYDEIAEAWTQGGNNVLSFRNCCVKAGDVVLIEYIPDYI